MSLLEVERMILVFLIGLFLGSACERRTAVTIEGGNVPKFHLSGTGRLGEALIFDPAEEAIAKTDPFDRTHAIWDIVRGTQDEPLRVQDLTITYGIVPPGYKQLKPTGGAELPSLIAGKRYRYSFVTVDAPWAAGYFEIRDNKATEVAGP
jgi:hypothetical protein